MSLAENLLNSLDENDYKTSATADIEPEEAHIVIGQDRVIRVPNNLKIIAVKGDKDVETVTVDCVRYWDGNDLSNFAIYVNYTLPDGSDGTYVPQTITRFDDIFSFDWTIGREITHTKGGLTFWIVAKLTDENEILIKQWSSLQNSELTIAQGGDKILIPDTEEEKDTITQLIKAAQDAISKAEESISNYNYEFIEELTLSQKDTFFRAAEPDGKYYRFSAIKYMVNIPASNTVSSYVNAVVNSNTNKYIVFYTPYSANKNLLIFGELWKSGDHWDNFYSSTTSEYNMSVDKKSDSPHLYEDGAYGDYISSINLNREMPAGTVIKVWGKRYNS